MLKKFKGNPILTPEPDVDQESMGVLNPGAIVKDGKVHLLYRAAGNPPDYKICVNLAVSRDGFNFERQYAVNPVLFPKEGTYDGGCIEDPRITHTDGWYYMTYACRPYPPGPYWEKGPWLAPANAPKKWKANLTISALARSRDLVTWERIGEICGGDVDDRDVILFPEKIGGAYWMFRRPAEWCGAGYPCEKPSMWICNSKQIDRWEGGELFARSEFDWEFKKVGGSSPPIRTDEGWLVLYHGVDRDHIYRTGAMITDLENPAKIIARYPHPILEPTEPCELEGIVPNVVFPTANVVLDDELFVYYGGGDKVCCVATVRLNKLVDEVLKHPVADNSGELVGA
jgi:predicted GH43/DUF377 family glycosyl hydrolase